MRVHAPHRVRPVLVLLSALTLALSAIATAGAVLASEGTALTEITKSASASSVMVDEEFTYTLTVKNVSDVTATGVVVTDELSNGLFVVSLAPSQGTCDAAGPGNEVSCALGDLAPQAQATLVITVDALECGMTIDNRGSAQASNQSQASHSETVLVDLVCDGAALNIRKVDENGARLAGAVFTIEGMAGTFTTDAQGKVCVTGLEQGTEWLVTETKAPAGYNIANPASQMVGVDNDGDCDSPDAVFVNARAQQQPAAQPTPTPTQAQAPPPAAVATPRESALAGGGGPRAGSLPNTAADQPLPVPVWAFAGVMLASLASLLWLRLAGLQRNR